MSGANENTPRNMRAGATNNCRSFGTVMDEWIRDSFSTIKRPTRLKYLGIIDRHIRPSIGEMDVQEVDEVYINEFLRQKSLNGRLDGSGGLSASYVQTMGIIISSVMNYAVEREYRVPMRARINKPVSEKTDIHVLSRAQQAKLEAKLSSDSSPTALGITIALNAGLRIGEVCALQWDDIDLESGIIHVRHTVARIKASEEMSDQSSKLVLDRPKTRNSKRDIPITNKLMKMLQAGKQSATSPFVVSNKHDFISPRTFEYRFHKILETYELTDVNFHSLRHTFATRCVEFDVDVKSLSEILGHANVSITLNTYVHPSFEFKRNQLEKVSLLS